MSRVSIITINYNDQDGLHRTFDSIFTQTVQDFEYIVIDGGSTDGSKDLIQEYSHKIDFWVSEKDKGIYNAMNKGISRATSEYVLFINSGDELSDANMLERTLPKLGDFDIIYGNIMYVFEDNERKIQVYPNDPNFSFFINDTIGHPGTFIRKSQFAHIGMYDESLKISSDWKWFIIAICLKKLTYKYLNTTVANFYFNGISSSKESLSIIRKEKEKVIKELFAEFPFDAITYYEDIKCKYNSLLSSKTVLLSKKLGFLREHKTIN